jgi:hypothetical protein
MSHLAKRLLNSLRTGELMKRGRDQVELDHVGQYLDFFEMGPLGAPDEGGFVYNDPLPYWVKVMSFPNAVEFEKLDDGSRYHQTRKL